MVYVLKLFACKVIENIRGIFDTSGKIVFVSVFLIATTMVVRLTQAAVELDSLGYFVIISVVHGVANVIDKFTMCSRSMIINSICRRRSDVTDNARICTQKTLLTNHC